jgi:hypothetical protein
MAQMEAFLAVNLNTVRLSYYDLALALEKALKMFSSQGLIGKAFLRNVHFLRHTSFCQCWRNKALGLLRSVPCLYRLHTPRQPQKGLD